MTTLNLTEIRISGDSLLAEQATPILSQLLKQSTQSTATSSIDVVLITQEPQSANLKKKFCSELIEAVLLEELTFRSKTLLTILNSIKDSSKIWIYAFSDDCFDSHFELALACDLRICFSSKAKVGFPSIECGTYPLNGFSRTGYENEKKLAEMWLASPVLSVLSIREGLSFDLLIDAHSNWENLAKQWIESNANSFSKRSSRSNSFFEKGYQWLRRDDQKQLNNLKMMNESESHLNSWERSAQIINKGFGRYKEGQELIAENYAQHLLSKAYINWLYRYVAQIPTDEGYKIFNTDFFPLLIEIQLEEVLPPIELIRLLLAHNFHIVFCCHDAELLRSNLEIIYAKLGKLDLPASIDSLWKKQAFWSQTELSHCHLALITSPYNRILLLIRGHAVVSGQFFENPKDPTMIELNWLNVQSDQSNQEIISKIFGEETLVFSTTPLGDQKMSIADFVLSRFCELVMKTAQGSGTELNRLLNSLKDLGWGRIANSVEWEKFISTRHMAYKLNIRDIDLMGLKLSAEYWDISGFQDAQMICNQVTQIEKPRAISPLEISNSLLMLAGYVSVALQKSAQISCPFHANAFVSAIIGIPKTMDPPTLHLKKLGTLRMSWSFNKYFEDCVNLIDF